MKSFSFVLLYIIYSCKIEFSLFHLGNYHVCPFTLVYYHAMLALAQSPTHVLIVYVLYHCYFILYDQSYG